VAKGFTQNEGEDYFDTYSPLVRLPIVCTLIALTVVHNLFLHQMVVKTPFLNG
jgi:hypothetical protein